MGVVFSELQNDLSARFLFVLGIPLLVTLLWLSPSLITITILAIDV